MNEYQLAAFLWLIVVAAAAAMPLILAAGGAAQAKFKDGHVRGDHHSDPSLPSIPSCPSSAG
jgi:hypothetical protein